MLPLGTLDRASDTPPYRQIAGDLRDAITSGRFPAESRLPSEAQLSSHYGVARMTVRQAIGELRSEGLVVAEHGKGVFVRARPPVRRLASDRFARRHRDGGKAPFLAESEDIGRPDVDQLEISREVPPPAVRELLRLGNAEPAVTRSRRYSLDGTPVQLAVSYVPAAIADGTTIQEPNPGPGGIYARLEDAGHRLTHFTEMVSVRMPTPDERRRLNLGTGIPVMIVLRAAHADDGRVLEVCDIVMAGPRYVLEYLIPAE